MGACWFEAKDKRLVMKIGEKILNLVDKVKNLEGSIGSRFDVIESGENDDKWLLEFRWYK